MPANSRWDLIRRLRVKIPDTVPDQNPFKIPFDRLTITRSIISRSRHSCVTIVLTLEIYTARKVSLSGCVNFQSKHSG